MKWSRKLNSDFFFICLLLLIAVLNIFIRLYSASILQADTPTYINAVRVLEGEEMPAGKWMSRPLKPLSLWGIIGISRLTHWGYYESFIAEALFFYLAMAIASYYLFKLFIPYNRFLAFLGSVMFISAYPVLRTGISLLTETGAWFFYLISIYFVYLFYQKPSNRNFYLSIALILIGLFWKEYNFLSAALFIIAVLFHRDLTLREKIERIIIYGLLSAVILLPWQFFIQFKFHYNYFDWYGHKPYYFRWQTYYYWLKSLFGVMLLGWLLAVVGFKKWSNLPASNKAILKWLFVVSFLMFTWRASDSRLYYVSAVPLTIMAIYGLEILFKKWSYVKTSLLYLLVLSANYIWLLTAGNFRQYLDKF